MTSTTTVSTGANGEPITGTSGDALANASATALNGNEFLQLMMTQLENQDPTSPSSSDPSEFLDELAEMTSVEQETDTAQNTSTSATEGAIAQAVGLIGDTVSYTDQTTGDSVTGQVQSVQITSSGATLTVNGVAGVLSSSITAVSPEGSGAGSAAPGTAGGAPS